jgi:hypothetical protein
MFRLSVLCLRAHCKFRGPYSFTIFSAEGDSHSSMNTKLAPRGDLWASISVGQTGFKPLLTITCGVSSMSPIPNLSLL